MKEYVDVQQSESRYIEHVKAVSQSRHRKASATRGAMATTKRPESFETSQVLLEGAWFFQTPSTVGDEVEVGRAALKNCLGHRVALVLSSAA